MANRLAAATSPYLLQHKDNPVDWWPWGEDAFAHARERDVPVLLSVGYASCHWCHVMAHESFEDAETARLMNSHFVSVKVDREERPDVDAVYMAVTQALTGHGGWPMTVFCTPEGRPFHAGTYYPSEPRHGMPSFRQILAAVAVGWRDEREKLQRAGKDVVDRLTALSAAAGPGDVGSVDAAALEVAVGRLHSEFDVVNGGFLGAPKFPTPMVMEFLVRAHARSGDATSLEMAARTAEGMARGGLYDQLAGGFARYSVDAEWVVPHFEKMLYDNALLLRSYAHLLRAAPEGGSAHLARRVATESADFLIADLGVAQGGFASSLDADTGGVEGATYVWTQEQLVEVLGELDGTWAAGLLAVTPEGSFEGGTSVLQRRADPGDEQRWASVRSRLRQARDQRPQPSRDDKVVAAWNGLAIAALADAGVLLEEPRHVAAAVAAAEYLREVHWESGRLHRTSLDAVAGDSAGVLEDYADVAEGVLALAQVTGEQRWLDWAGELLDVALEHFSDRAAGWFDTADDAEDLVVRPRDPADSSTPSGASALAGACLTYAALSGSQRHREVAESTLASLLPLVVRAPRFAGWAAAVGEALVAGPVEVAVIGRSGDPAYEAMLRTARSAPAPGAVVVGGRPDAQDGIQLLRGRGLVAGSPAAYVCRQFACQSPVSDEQSLSALLSG